MTCVCSQPIVGKDYRKQGPAGTGDKPYTMPKPKQDGPPPGGFAPIRTKRFVGVTTSIPSGIILGITAAGMLVGMWKVGQFNIKRRGWKQEKLEARRALVPYLQVCVCLCARAHTHTAGEICAHCACVHACTYVCLSVCLSV